MKLALLSTNADLGGAAIVTRRLCDALRSLGHDARMIVARGPADKRKGVVLSADGQQTTIMVPRRQWLPNFLAERAELWFKGVARKNIFKVSTGRFGVHLEYIPFVKEADAILVNWASQGFLSLSSLEKLLEMDKPVIYTMHDLWPATAICHLPGSCRHFVCQPNGQVSAINQVSNSVAKGKDCFPCPYLSTKRGAELIARIAEQKQHIFSHPRLHLVAVSHWQRSQALESFILNNSHSKTSTEGTSSESSPPKITVIPHPFPIDEYLPGNKLVNGKRLIIMAAQRLDDPVKDLPSAVEALNIFARDYPALAADVEVAFVGELRDPRSLRLMELPYKLYGHISGEELRLLYGRASVVLSSSQYETMGATLMEGMACGAIPVTFGDAGQTDIVDDLINGFVAPIHTPASLAFALSTAFEVINDRDQSLSSAADNSSIPFSTEFLHAEVGRRFSPAIIANRYIQLISRNK